MDKSKEDSGVVVNVSIESGSGELFKGLKRNFFKAHRRIRSNLLAIILSILFLPLGYLVQGRYGWFVGSTLLLLLSYVTMSFVLTPIIWVVCVIDIAVYSGLEDG